MSTADFSMSMNDFPEFGPLRSFTPMASQNGSSGARSHPFAVMTAPGGAVAGGGGAGSSSGYGDRGSLRTSQDISMLLRSGMLMEAALLSSNASRMHVIHDAGEQGRQGGTAVPTCACVWGVGGGGVGLFSALSLVFCSLPQPMRRHTWRLLS